MRGWHQAAVTHRHVRVSLDSVLPLESSRDEGRQRATSASSAGAYGTCCASRAGAASSAVCGRVHSVVLAMTHFALN